VIARCPAVRLLASALGATCLIAQTPPPVWKWDYSKIEATVNKVRAGRDLTPNRWPNGARVAVALSFDMKPRLRRHCPARHCSNRTIFN
jgi:hypothetical protein